MNTKVLHLLVVSVIISSLLITSCASTTNSNPTITFTLDGCVYNGPKTILKTSSLDWVIADNTHDSYFYVVVTLAKERSIEDLANWHSTDQPDWVIGPLYWEQADSGDQTRTKKLNLEANAAYEGDPLYIVCFMDEEKVGQAGPIKVK